MVVLMVGMLSLCRICSVPVDNGPHYVLDGTANEIWPKKATSVGTGAFGPVISIHMWFTNKKLMGFSGKNLKIFGNHVVPRTGQEEGGSLGAQARGTRCWV